MSGVVLTGMAQCDTGKPNVTIYIHKLYVLPTQCIYVFCVDLRTNSDYFPIQH